jgi:pimeloyl-ACP methyl ester carboxylesterase
VQADGRRVTQNDVGGRGGAWGDGFAVPPRMWRLALQAALEDGRRPRPLGGLRGTRCETEFGRLFVRRGPSRDGVAVVLVHGVIVSSRYFLPLAGELARDCPVLVLDLPGYGLSGGDAADLTVLADAVVAAARALGHNRLTLVGNSFGAQVAVEAALRHPAHVERLVLIGPTVDPAARGLLRQYVRWQRNAPDEHLSVLPVMARDLADIGPRGAARMLRIMLADRPEAKLPRVHQPTLVIRGGRDRLVPEAWARAVAELLPDAVLRVLPGYAHMPQWSGPRAIAPLVRAHHQGRLD